MRSREPDVPVVIHHRLREHRIGGGGGEGRRVSLRGETVPHRAAPRDRRERAPGAAISGARLRACGARRAEARPTIVAESVAMRRVARSRVSRGRRSDTPVLLLGESGTGKELLARLLHDESPRRGGPFVAVNCSAIPETLLESQLFGHRRGRLHRRREDRRGLFQEAEGGTLFLDEIGDMPLALQGKLLRVLQEREVHPLGAPAPVPVDVRTSPPRIAISSRSSAKAGSARTSSTGST